MHAFRAREIQGVEFSSIDRRLAGITKYLLFDCASCSVSRQSQRVYLEDGVHAPRFRWFYACGSRHGAPCCLARRSRMWERASEELFDMPHIDIDIDIDIFFKRIFESFHLLHPAVVTLRSVPTLRVDACPRSTILARTRPLHRPAGLGVAFMKTFSTVSRFPVYSHSRCLLHSRSNSLLRKRK